MEDVYLDHHPVALGLPPSASPFAHRQAQSSGRPGMRARQTGPPRERATPRSYTQGAIGDTISRWFGVSNLPEEFMERFSAVGRALAVLLAIVSAFVSNPVIAPLLLLFGGIAAIGNTPERNVKNYQMAIILVVGSSLLEAVPYIGGRLDAVFSSLGIAFVGASMVAITITLEQRIVRDWMSPSSKPVGQVKTAL
jgi:hypothetical protein